MLRVALVSFTIALLASGCERYKPTYQVPQKAVPTGNGEGGFMLPKTGDANSGPGTPAKVAAEEATEIQLVSSKLVGGEDKYQTVTKFADVASPKTKLEKAEGGVKYSLSTLPAGKSDVLIVEVYEGDALRFIAKKANTQLGGKANAVQIPECQILAAPWDGTTTDGACNWTIEEAK